MKQYAMDACCSGIHLDTACYDCVAMMSATHVANKDGLSQQEYMCILIFDSLCVASHMRYCMYGTARLIDHTGAVLTSCLILVLNIADQKSLCSNCYTSGTLEVAVEQTEQR